MGEPEEEILQKLAEHETPVEAPASAERDALPSVPEDAIQIGLHDKGWEDGEWEALVRSLEHKHIVSWKEIAASILGELNPSQVGTSMASTKGFQLRYGEGTTMRVVAKWFQEQDGKCVDCGTRLDLQSDHSTPKNDFEEKTDADFIENMVIRCRRCNVIRMPSHKLGGRTFLTTQAALMWILLVVKPRTFWDFIRLCRLYGMTMADVRLRTEAWCMAVWLAKEDPPAYEIEDDENGSYDLMLWPDNAITRRRSGEEFEGDPVPLYRGVSGNSRLGVVFQRKDNPRLYHFYDLPVSWLAFSAYDLPGRPRSILSLKYTPPKRKTGVPPRLESWPSHLTGRMVAHAIAAPDGIFVVEGSTRKGRQSELIAARNLAGKRVTIKVNDPDSVTLISRPAPRPAEGLQA